MNIFHKMSLFIQKSEKNDHRHCADEKGGDPVAHPTRGLGPRGFLTEEEKQNMPKVNGALIRRILSYLLPYRLQFVLVFVTILVSAVLGLLPSIIIGRIVDEALVGKNMALLIRLLILAFVTLSASQVISVLESYINSWISQRIIFDMKNQMYDHLQHMPHAFFTSEKQGDIITRMNTHEPGGFVYHELAAGAGGDRGDPAADPADEKSRKETL